jgi:cytochrome b pre-mRNA-processing protein 3
MKKFASMFYGRLESYAAALDNKDGDELAAALKRNFHPQTEDPALSMDGLASYMLRAEAQLAEVGEDVVETGRIDLADAAA